MFWFLRGSARLSPQHRALIADLTVPVFVSAVTGWEIATKVRLGKWPEAAPLLPGLEAAVVRAGFQQLPLTLAQAERAGSMTFAHKDPFDRLLAAQSIDLNMPIVTVDAAFGTMGCKVV